MDWDDFADNGVLGDIANSAQDLDWDDFADKGVLGDIANSAQDLDWDSFADKGVLGSGTRSEEDYSAFMHEYDFFGDCLGLGEIAGTEGDYI